MRSVQRIEPRTTQTQRVSPRLVVAGTVLQMSSEELRLRLQEEAHANPALEIVWENLCPSCGRGLSGDTCWFCRNGQLESGGPPAIYDGPLPGEPRARRWDGEENGDPLERVHSPCSLQDHVLLQARLTVANRDLPIAEYLVAGLSDEGLLEVDVEEAAQATGADAARVCEVLSALQGLDPPGVCARSVQESVLIQVRQLADEERVPELAEPILARHWRDLANHSYEKIARRLGVSCEAVQEAAEFIRTRLCPYPGRLYHSPYDGAGGDHAPALRFDLAIRRELADYVVEVVRPYDFELRVSEAYRRLGAVAGNGHAGAAEYQMALDQYRRATWLLQSIKLREQTLRDIGEYLIRVQRPFLDTESEQKMKPLTQTRVASETGKHPSTVSRAISGKFVLLPSGRLMGLERFFSPAVAPKTVIAELLAKENPEKPLTDEQICRILRIRGFSIARRTVAKYRLALRLPSSIQRGYH